MRILAMLLAIIATACLALPAVAAGPTVALGNSVLELDAGQVQPLSITVSDVQALYGLEIHLRFDPTVVQVADADPAREGVQVAAGDFLSADFVAQNQADNQSGSIDYAVTQVNPNEPKSGSGTLLVVQFQGSAAGRGSQIEVVNGILTTRDGELIPATFAKGEIKVKGASSGSEPPPTFTPQPQAAPPSATVQPTAAAENPAATPAAASAGASGPSEPAVVTATQVVPAVAEATRSPATTQKVTPVVAHPTSSLPGDGAGGASGALAPASSPSSTGEPLLAPSPEGTQALSQTTPAAIAKAPVDKASTPNPGGEAPKRLVAAEPAPTNRGQASPWLLVGGGALLSLAGGLALMLWLSVRRGRA
jgi:hypothetical protein